MNYVDWITNTERIYQRRRRNQGFHLPVIRSVGPVVYKQFELEMGATVMNDTFGLRMASVSTLEAATPIEPKPTRTEAETAVRTLLRWAGDNPRREGLIDTPKRVVRAFEEHFRGYDQDPVGYLQRTFAETDGYDEMAVLRGIRFESHCEHHLAPIIGRVWVAYVPSGRVVGISKIARVVDAYAKRMQIQEKMTAQIANTINEALKPHGVGVIIKAKHHCMTTRGVHKPDTDMVTSRMLGCFRDDAMNRQEFLAMAQ